MQAAYAIEVEGLELGIAVSDAGIFRFHTTEARLSGLERLRFVSLHDVQRTVCRAHATKAGTPLQRPDAELSRSAALEPMAPASGHGHGGEDRRPAA